MMMKDNIMSVLWIIFMFVCVIKRRNLLDALLVFNLNSIQTYINGSSVLLTSHLTHQYHLTHLTVFSPKVSGSIKLSSDISHFKYP